MPAWHCGSNSRDRQCDLPIASVPEFGPYAHTHGSTYAEALQNAQEVLEMLIEDYQVKGRQLPQPAIAS